METNSEDMTDFNPDAFNLQRVVQHKLHWISNNTQSS